MQQFAGGKGALSGTVTDLAGQPRFDTKFDITAKDAGKAFQFAGLPKTPPGKLGALKLNGTLAGGAKDVAYDVDFSIAGIGASGRPRARRPGSTRASRGSIRRSISRPRMPGRWRRWRA